MKKSYFPLPILHGTAGIIAQLILLRELPQIFYGNELSLGFILTAWLFWAAVGSGLVGRSMHSIKAPEKVFTFLSILSFIVSLLLLVGIRYLRLIFNITPGEIVSIPFIFIISNAVVLPIALIQGILFTILIRLFKNTDLSQKTNIIYLLESGGALCGCLFAYLIAFHYFNAFQTLFVINFIRFAHISYFLFSYPKKQRITFRWIVLTIALFCIAMAPNQSLNTLLYQKTYEPFFVINVVESKYGSIIQTQQADDSITFFENGLNLFTTDDILTNEESTQFALLAHPEPRHVLLLGGGINGCIKYILMHQTVEHITYVELDPKLIKVALETLPSDKRDYLTDEKVKLVFEDARSFLEHNQDHYDVVISYLPKPYTLQTNRFYSSEFFKLIKMSLLKNGVFSFTVPSSESFINNEQALLLKSLDATIKGIFPATSIIPGNTNVFLAFHGPLPPISADFFIERIHARKLDLIYINQFFLTERLSADNIDYLKQRLEQTLNYRINFDLKPVLYYYTFLLWSNIASRGFTDTIALLQNISPLHIYGTLCAIAVFTLWYIYRRKKKKHVLAMTIATVGLTEISLEIIIVLLVQIYLGNIYSFIALVIGGYMGGLTLGAHLAYHKMIKVKDQTTLLDRLHVLELAMCLAPLVVVCFPLIFNHVPIIPFIKKSLFFLTMVAIGFIGGMQFPIANALFLKTSQEQNKEIGSMYGFDLFGSAIGAALISLLLIPLVGIIHTLIFLVLVNTVCFIALFSTKRRKSF